MLRAPILALLLVSCPAALASERPPTVMKLPRKCRDHFRGTRYVDVSNLIGFDLRALTDGGAGIEEIKRTDFALATPYFNPAGNSDTERVRGVPVSGETLLWLARMVYGEARDQPESHRVQVLWTAYHRFWYLEYFRNLGRHRTGIAEEDHLQYFLRQFSQPLNPNWNRGERYCPRVRAKGACSKSMIEAREAKQKMKWEEIPEEYRDLAFRFALGLVPQPPRPERALDFGAIGATECDEGLSDAFFMSHSSPKPLKKLPRRKDGKPELFVHRFCKDAGYEIPDVMMVRPPWLDCDDAPLPARRELASAPPPPPAVPIGEDDGERHGAAARELVKTVELSALFKKAVVDGLERSEWGRKCLDWAR